MKLPQHELIGRRVAIRWCYAHSRPDEYYTRIHTITGVSFTEGVEPWISIDTGEGLPASGDEYATEVTIVRDKKEKA